MLPISSIVCGRSKRSMFSENIASSNKRRNWIKKRKGLSSNQFKAAIMRLCWPTGWFVYTECNANKKEQQDVFKLSYFVLSAKPTINVRGLLSSEICNTWWSHQRHNTRVPSKNFKVRAYSFRNQKSSENTRTKHIRASRTRLASESLKRHNK